MKLAGIQRVELKCYSILPHQYYAPIGGGKDSCYAMVLCVAAGHDIVALGHLRPNSSEELDSFMIQSVGSNVVPLIAEAMDLPLLQVDTDGRAVSSAMHYEVSPGDEVEDLFTLLSRAKVEFGVDAVSSGAIASNYQRIRVENVCERLGLVSLAYLWKRDQSELLSEMTRCGMKATVIKIAAFGLHQRYHLGKEVGSILGDLIDLMAGCGLNVCGEGGEYETFTTDCPLFKKWIILDSTETVTTSEDEVAPVAYIKIKEAHLEIKPEISGLSQRELVYAFRRKLPFWIQTEIAPEGLEPTVEPSHPSVKHGRPVIELSATGPDESSDWFWVSGLCGKGHPESATRTVLLELEACLAKSGLAKSDVVAVHLYISSMRKYETINRVYKSVFDRDPPCRICVQCPLPLGVTILMECAVSRLEKSVLHIQSVSSWAPANIGPYSQVVKAGNFVHVSGLIGLEAVTMRLPQGAKAQARLSFNQVTEIVMAISPNADPGYVLYGICFVGNAMLLPTVQRELGEAWIDRVVFAVVSNLPRGAFFEWQFVYHRVLLHYWRASKKASRVDGATLRYTVYQSKEEEFLVIAHVHDDEGSFTSSTAERAVSLILYSMRGRSPVHCKVLYDATKINMESVYGLCAKVFGKVQWTYAVIPALLLGTANEVLTLVFEHRGKRR